MRIPTPSSVPSSLLSCPWKCVVSSLVRPQLTLRLWPRKRTLSWRRALQVAAPLASQHCANRRPYPPPRHPGNCASTTPSSVRRPESAPSGGARLDTSSRPPRLLLPRLRETGRPAAKKLRGRPMGEKYNDSVGPPLRPLLPR